jgi:hypothetical protein
MTAAPSESSGVSAPDKKVYLVNIGVKISPRVFSEFEQLSAKRGVTVSELARHVITSHVAEPTTLTLMKEAMREVLSEFKKDSGKA